MTFYRLVQDKTTGEEYFETALTGHNLLNTALLNKGSAFSDAERHEFGLLGLLPPYISPLEQQAMRAYANYQREGNDLQRHIFLVDLMDRNETLFFRLVQEHITEMLPIIYTPVVGTVSQQFSHIYRRSRGLYVPFPQRDKIDEMLDNLPHSQVAVLVVTDGERILGLGDLGIGGMGIPIGKLSLYTLCAGINPATTLPVVLDVGTNNKKLLDDPLYLGWRHERIRGKEYDEFVEQFVLAVQRRFPNSILHWEDFAKQNAGRLLERYQDRVCSFNDDIQGTGAVTLAGLLAALKVIGGELPKQRIVLLGAGSAATGISEQIVLAMQQTGVSEAAARATIWLVDSQGLVHTGRTDLEPAKQAFAQPIGPIDAWARTAAGEASLVEVVRHVHPTILIGTAAQPGAFSEAVVREMAAHTERPIVFPLSNPTSMAEATPEQVITWSDGRALVATGSPFAPVSYGGRTFRIGQCNNAYIFPGVGLGVIAAQSRRITASMFVAAAHALAAASPKVSDPEASLYPAMEEIRELSFRVAMAVATEAQRLALAPATTTDALAQRVRARMWQAQYPALRKVKE